MSFDVWYNFHGETNKTLSCMFVAGRFHAHGSHSDRSVTCYWSWRRWATVAKVCCTSPRPYTAEILYQNPLHAHAPGLQPRLIFAMLPPTSVHPRPWTCYSGCSTPACCSCSHLRTRPFQERDGWCAPAVQWHARRPERCRGHNNVLQNCWVQRWR